MSDAEVLLQRIVEEAAGNGADRIEFERVPDGLEISYFIGHAGRGRVLDDRKLEAALFRLVAERTRKRRTFEVDVGGRPVTMKCEWYESFMEDCFRLHFVKRKASADSGRKTRRRRT